MTMSLAAALPYFDLPVLKIPLGFADLPIQPFGILVAIGVIVGANLLRRYGERHGQEEEHILGMTAYTLVGGFVGAHVLDVLMYDRGKLAEDPLILVKLWAGISSYGGFVGGGIAFGLYLWKRKLPAWTWADTVGVGLLTGFTFGRLGCTIVHDHMGRTTDFFLGIDYPYAELKARSLLAVYPEAGALTRIHNLGLYELLYLIPMCAVILYIAFRKKQVAAGVVAVLIMGLYAPVRFFLEFLRLNHSDPRYVGLTFAQWMSLVVFGVAVYGVVHLTRHGKPQPLASERKTAVVTAAPPPKASDSKAGGGKPSGGKPGAKRKS